VPKTHGSYGRGQDPTWMDEVHCSGGEDRLDTCRFAGWGNEDCSHSEDAGVLCLSEALTTTTSPPEKEGI